MSFLDVVRGARSAGRMLSVTHERDVASDLQRVIEIPVTTACYLLTVVEGPDQGKTFRLDGARPGRVLVGQSPACEIRLTDPLVSRRHAALDVTDRELRLTDLGSTNRTYANGLVVCEVLLRGGEVIRIGATTLRVDMVGEEAAVALSTATRFGRVIGASVEMRRIYPLCERLAGSEIPVIIEGETGTGKEVLAESIHDASPRAQGPFMVFDCTAVPPNLVESELFGHERGAFTGAISQRRGIFEQAHKGTLFIDEIGDLDLSLQPKLLRALQRSEIRRVGGDRWIPLDVRILAATRRDLDREVAAGRFRDDLFFRLAVARIELPPLRQRRGDILHLAEHFWNELGGAPGSLPHDLAQSYEEYAWPGNVRELYNAVVRRLALGDLGPLPTSTRPPPMEGTSTDAIDEVLALGLPLPRARQRIVEEFERRYVERVVEAHGGNVSRAAAASGIGHRYFQKIRARLNK
jgi:two-component system, NtrC family, response regulator HydG